jgi:hypothetical protein
VTLNPDIVDRPVFERIYVCLDACKRGFLAGCRRVVGIDGCFLKGSVSGQLLCAIGRDANNQMYPIAWATVEVESYDSWQWFLSYLQKDIQINNHGEGYVFISDQQKCQILWNGKGGFEVEENQYRRFTVNLEKMSCSCRYWVLSGLPCSHAISAIYTVGKDIEDFIAPCYMTDIYNQIYDHVLQPLEGKENWPVATNRMPFPPIRNKMPGRPKTEKRRGRES